MKHMMRDKLDDMPGLPYSTAGILIASLAMINHPANWQAACILLAAHAALFPLYLYWKSSWKEKLLLIESGEEEERLTKPPEELWPENVVHLEEWKARRNWQALDALKRG
jgi:hypothetical protein